MRPALAVTTERSGVASSRQLIACRLLPGLLPGGRQQRPPRSGNSQRLAATQLGEAGQSM